MANLMGDDRADGLTGRGVDPEGTDGVVVASAGGEPLRLVEQVDLHLILVEIRLALPRLSHFQRRDVGLIELLRLLQQVVDIHAHTLRQFAGVGIVAESGLPEHEEVFALLGAEPRPLGIAAQHVYRAELRRLVVLVIVLDLRHIHHLDRRACLGHLQRGAGPAAGHLDIGLTRLLRGVLRHLERELLAGTASALAADELQPFAAILDSGCPDGARRDSQAVEGGLTIHVDLRLRECRSHDRRAVALAAATSGKNRCS